MADDEELVIVAVPKDVAGALQQQSTVRFLQFLAGISVGAVTDIQRFLANPVAFIEGVIELYIFETFVFPFLNQVFAFTNTIVGSILGLGFGSDGRASLAPERNPGLFDAFVWLGFQFTTAILTFGRVYEDATRQFNAALRAAIDPLGPLAFPIIIAVQIIEVALLAVFAYIAIRLLLMILAFFLSVVDIPGVNQEAVFDLIESIDALAFRVVDVIQVLFPGA